MKRLLSIVLLALSPFALRLSPLHAQDFSRLSERTIMGTARYVGMAGAMTAIGGDPSSVFDNPACLGLYQHSEVLITFDEMIDHTWQSPEYLSKPRRTLFMCPQASLVISIPTYSSHPWGVQTHNFMFAYRRMHTYNRTYEAYAYNEPSLGSLLPALDIPVCNDPLTSYNKLNLWEAGSVSEFAFDWSMNFGHQFYFGMGLHIQDYILNSDAEYIEKFDSTSVEGVRLYTENSTSLQFSGVSCNFSFGFLYRPVQWLRIGFGLQTPSLGSLRTYTSGTLYAQTDSLRRSVAPSMSSRDRSFHLPLHLSTSVAFQCGAYGMLSFQHDYTKQSKEDAVHSLRVGLEVIPVLGFYINAGYAYESTFEKADKIIPMDPTFDRQDTYFLHPRQTQYASCAVGYRGENVIVQAAYQYRWQGINLFAHELSNPYDIHTDTHRIVFTIGWRR